MCSSSMGSLLHDNKPIYKIRSLIPRHHLGSINPGIMKLIQKECNNDCNLNKRVVYGFLLNILNWHRLLSTVAMVTV